MSIYQLVSLFVALYLIWNLLTVYDAIINKRDLVVSVWARLFYTVVYTNLVMAFAGVPW